MLVLQVAVLLWRQKDPHLQKTLLECFCALTAAGSLAIELPLGNGNGFFWGLAFELYLDVTRTHVAKTYWKRKHSIAAS